MSQRGKPSGSLGEQFSDTFAMFTQISDGTEPKQTARSTDRGQYNFFAQVISLRSTRKTCSRSQDVVGRWKKDILCVKNALTLCRSSSCTNT